MQTPSTAERSGNLEGWRGAASQAALAKPKPERVRGEVDSIGKGGMPESTHLLRNQFAHSWPRHYVQHHQQERNHQGLDNVIPFPSPDDRVGASTGTITRRERLGGLLNFYHREAA